MGREVLNVPSLRDSDTRGTAYPALPCWADAFRRSAAGLLVGRPFSTIRVHPCSSVANSIRVFLPIPLRPPCPLWLSLALLRASVPLWLIQISVHPRSSAAEGFKICGL
jgi:hypothetical protein